MPGHIINFTTPFSKKKNIKLFLFKRFTQLINYLIGIRLVKKSLKIKLYISEIKLIFNEFDKSILSIRLFIISELQDLFSLINIKDSYFSLIDKSLFNSRSF